MPTVTTTRLAFIVLLLSVLLAALRVPKYSNPTFTDLESIPSLEATGKQEKILLVTAHPDDECLFFAPTLLGSTFGASQDVKTNPELFSVCLSIGDADGLGSVRRDEYERSLDVLGIKKDNRMVLDLPELQDSIHLPWKAEDIANAVQPFVEKYGITTILTFDQGGISGHPNHKSIPQGITHLISTYPSDLESAAIPRPRLYTLITVPLSIKYISILAPLLAKYDLYAAQILHYIVLMLESRASPTSTRSDSGSDGTKPSVSTPQAYPNSIPVFVSGMKEYLTALRAMKEHWSQLVWFRWLNVMFSRYMWVNEWVEV
ncbi:hypothetical protein D9758_002919 [Tetrapyrgos nigripes]|uniref:N-acetylglucosaminylphosphatidylinositol deacetylase n=1 Tax=Tetrapyrgos nigripes TaxID=182062 RepID=A0A8H5GPY9_9AGAR|nr:hypothetical protein D9758_002919 [Tetrapyrgos nigripes]